MYEQSKGKRDFRRSWKDKKQDHQDQRKKGFKPPHFRGNSFQQRQGVANDRKVPETEGIRKRQPIECWGCGGDHLQRFCPQQGKSTMAAHNIQEEDTVENAARGMPRIYAALDYRQADHQSHMIEVERMIMHNENISILIDSGASHSYVEPSVVGEMQA